FEHILSTTTIIRLNKRKQQLKATRAKKCAKKSRKQTDYEDLVWSDQEIDKRASDYFAVLLMAKVKSMELELESVDVESVESLEVKSVELVKSLEVELVESLKVESTVDILAEKDIDKRTKIRLAIEELDRMLKTDDNKIDKGIRVRLQASLQYLWLKYQGQTRIGASTTIAKNRNIFMKVSSLLDNERISMKALKQKQLYVRKQHGDGLENCDSNAKNRKKIYIELEPVLLEYNDKDLTILIEKDIPLEEKQHCIIIHDETTLSTNDDKKTG
ncbi:7158_t:CDS:2, partial [Gigaspora margarita]